jgi:hypothetical protein
MRKNLRKSFIKCLIITGVFCSSSFCFSQNYTQHQKDSILNAYVTLPNSDIKMVPPAFFKAFLKDGKFGFIHEGAGSSISIEEIKGTAFTLLVKGMTKEYFAKQGVTLIAQEDVKTKQNKDATLMLVGFKVKSKDGEKEVEYERLMLFTGDYNRTIWINANYPAIIRKVLLAALRESLLSVQYN